MGFEHPHIGTRASFPQWKPFVKLYLHFFDEGLCVGGVSEKRQSPAWRHALLGLHSV